MVSKILTTIFSLFIFLFIFWRRLKEDYQSNQIFSCSLFILIGIGLGNLVAKLFYKNGWFWFSLVGASSGLFIGIYKYKIKFHEVFQAFVNGLLPWLVFIFLIDSAKNKSLISFLGFVVLTLLIGLFYLIEGNYKKFSWYKSGKIGLSGLITAGAFFFLRFLVALIFPFVLSFVGKLEIIVSAVLAFTFSFFAYRLSQK